MDDKARAQAELMDGKLLLVTNVADLEPQEVVSRYKARADIECGFRVLKSEIDIAPVNRAHCGMQLKACFFILAVSRMPQRPGHLKR